jgi:hypothetical protein
MLWNLFYIDLCKSWWLYLVLNDRQQSYQGYIYVNCRDNMIFKRGCVNGSVGKRSMGKESMTGIGRKYMLGSWFENYIKVFAKYIHIYMY